MNMKHRITALLLAGLLTASLAACEKIQQRPQNTPGGDETTTTMPAPDQPGGNETPAPVIWTDVDENVYVTAPMTLTGVDNTSDVSTVKAMDILKRVKIGSNNQSVVVKNDKQYYAASKNLTTEDLEGLTFSTEGAGKTLYADGAVNVRTYASSESFSKAKKTLALNETVTLVSTGSKWVKVQYKTDKGEDDFGFVFASYLSETVVKDGNDLTNYPEVEELTHTAQYVIVEKVNLRKAPSMDKSVEVLTVLSKDTQVTVIGKVVVDGRLWYQVWASVQVEEGQSPESLEGFVSADCLDVNKGAVSTRTLEDMLAEYTYFTKVDAQTLYAMSRLNVRSTPSLDVKDNENLIETLNKATAVKVVAIGENEDIMWAMIEYKEGEYYFVSYKYLTTDPEGNEAAPTLEQLLATYTAFKACPEKTVYASGVVNCNTFPGNDTEVVRKLAKGDAVTVVASGSVRGNEWYIFETSDGKLFFAGASMFSETAPTA